jgi:hypothetical protein
MSNTLGVAMVTAGLRHVLTEALVGVPAGGVENAAVTTGRPDELAETDDAPVINVFLYRVTTNAALAGVHLPSRRADGTVVERPLQALDLHYLLTFSGDESVLEPQRMLGVAVSRLTSRPVLSRELVRRVIEQAREADPTAWEQHSDLAEQVEVVRFTLLPLDLDELSTLWSTFFQVPYRLSVVYCAAVVLVESDEMPAPALPVLSRGIDAAALSVPSISRVVPETAPSGPVTPGTRLRIEGAHLRGTYRTRVRLGDVEVPVPQDQVTGTRLLVDLPDTVRAGVRPVQVVHPRLVGRPPVERAGAESAAAPVVVRPLVTGPVRVTAGGPAGHVDVTVPLTPVVAGDQRVVLFLNEHHPPEDRPARAYTFRRPSPAPDAQATTTEVTVPVRDVVPGEYLVRLQVDGAESVLRAGPDERFDGPRVTIP